MFAEKKLEVVVEYFSSKDSYRIRRRTQDSKNFSGKKVIAEVEYSLKKFNAKKVILLCTKLIIWTYIGKETRLLNEKRILHSQESLKF